MMVKTAANRPTLKTISDLSGLAVPTVSRALKDAPDISAKTKRRVREIATRIGYVPNRAGVRLRTGKTNVISLVLSTEHDMMNHTARLISAVAGGLQDTDYHLIVTPYFPSDDPMKPVRYIVETQSADAVILNQTQPQDPRISYLMDKGFPFATHGRTDWCDRHPYYDFDNAEFGRIAAELLIGRGRRNLMLIAPPLEQNYARNMVEGARSQATGPEMTFTVMAGASSDSTAHDIQNAAARALEGDPSIDGIICGSTTAAMSAVAMLEQSGHVVGENVDVFAKEAIPFLNLFRPAILAVQEDVAAAGAFLAHAARQAIENPRLAPMQGLDIPKAP